MNAKDTTPCRFSLERGWIPVRQGVDSLSPRELQVLKMLAEGKLMKQVMYELQISRGTACEYRERIRNKLNISTDPELIHFALAHNLVPNRFDNNPNGATDPNILPLNLANQKRA